jgi:hypothetical protein
LKGETGVRIYIGGVAAVLAIAAIGCGSGGDTTEVALTKAQFIKRGDAICRAAQEKKTDAIQAWSLKPANKGKTLADWSTQELEDVYSSLALPPIKEASEELAALTPPAGDPKAEQVVKSLASAVEAVEEKPRRAIKEAPYSSADKLAQAYGFEACGSF